MQNRFKGTRKLRLRATKVHYGSRKGKCLCGTQNGWTVTKTERKEAVTCEKCLKFLQYVPAEKPEVIGQLTLF